MKNVGDCSVTRLCKNNFSFVLMQFPTKNDRSSIALPTKHAQRCIVQFQGRTEEFETSQHCDWCDCYINIPTVCCHGGCDPTFYTSDEQICK